MGFRQGSVGDGVEEGNGLTEVEYEEGEVGFLEGVEDLDEVWVWGEEGHEFGLVVEALAVCGIG